MGDIKKEPKQIKKPDTKQTKEKKDENKPPRWANEEIVGFVIK